MNQELINFKIELLQEQIDNLEKSGFFTEKEMDRLSLPLIHELLNLKVIRLLGKPKEKAKHIMDFVRTFFRSCNLNKVKI